MAFEISYDQTTTLEKLAEQTESTVAPTLEDVNKI